MLWQVGLLKIIFYEERNSDITKLERFQSQWGHSKDELSSKLRSFRWMIIELARSEDVARWGGNRKIKEIRRRKVFKGFVSEKNFKYCFMGNLRLSSSDVVGVSVGIRPRTA